jgi:hypothetical protein
MDVARAAAKPPVGRTPVPRADQVAETLAAVGRPHACLLPAGPVPRAKAAREFVIAR